MELLAQLNEAIGSGHVDKVTELTEKAIEDGIKLEDIIYLGMIPAMDKVGDKFHKGLAYIPEMLLAARAMQSGLAIVKPKLLASGVKSETKAVIGSVKGDLHDIGKNLVIMMMEGAGFEVIDLGVDVAPEKFVAAVKDNKPQIVGMSALLSTTLSEMKAVIELLKEEGYREQVKVLIGGAPVSQDFADKIGADGYGEDASTAVKIVRELLGVR